ncbi:metallophosphoesterase [Pseudomonas guariconensis]|uniref:metallophosphoesterase n=1 Tax=Pseudomonas guariconensis TaxID=1288410 RepID=UPI0018A9CB5E|nr:metallophosphoesterase [Pseudomonas guariconensis]MBF8742109.1 metallophosphoesterase [Pseudomonas guariconensis]MBF8751105.1 metallophosphoesterase [Pseudomonas guariconensis]
MTDLHLGGEKGFLLRNQIDTADSLSKVLDCVASSKFDYLIVTGDISEDSSSESYSLFCEAIRSRNISSVVCLSGNHDSTEVMREILKPIASSNVFHDNSWLFFCINTSIRGSDCGEVSQEDLKALDELLARRDVKHAAIFMHHHSIPVQSIWIDKYGLQNSQEFIKIIEKHGKVRAVISGHVHQASETRRNGVAYHTTPATSVQFTPFSDKPLVCSTSPAWRKWYFGTDGKVTSQIYYI